jgi:hypothetical protein
VENLTLLLVLCSKVQYTGAQNYQKFDEKNLISFCTDKKKLNKNFLIHQDIQTGSVAKSYMTNSLLILYKTKFLLISSNIRKSFIIYDFASCNRSHLNFLLYEENFLFFFISVLLTNI